MRYIMISILAVLCAGCSSVAEQALESGDAISQPTTGNFLVSGIGVYRLRELPNGVIAANRFCGDQHKRSGFNGIKSQPYSTNEKIEDVKATDLIKISINPVNTEKRFERVVVDAGIEFNGIPTVKRVVEGYSLDRLSQSDSDTGQTLDSEFVMAAIGENCRRSINEESWYRRDGKPVFVFAVAKAKNIYTKLSGAPSVVAAVGKARSDEKYADFTFTAGELRFQKGNNKVFGYRFIPIGDFASRPIPKTKR